ncbi:PPOX class F420-dependent oxidoreductase [Mycobacteroides chelonae]|jgi:PPOX class probable F420-dependent enzyme|uniref:PPOX class F420-dependent enzyme n=1 Tax=Mycobacteroides chelonae TaxID=1774 RepID=A0AB73LPV7_MYCCH|nr:PPOX class F420-dependent oxidoreductase [Mycobacteroides chelonae]MBF9327576.1 PPOX class F420-dependent oxidoreductase [Mycobacteroides chelonae]MBF9421753.1 PPOX class F420-dependent oxidoreductase [Mycobacteroides chelonae]MBF9436057.1 PPOX class F420-dependent oxidoreductase [Mycobacteroides chelonae]MBV6361664.1 PPOX class F420-dependent oxidoreductase [Mycobacteroides chelonae]MEC4837697.1 PPOX class F420-dependent oxidoreductase [Mycobacteroides chelonae]
MHEMTREQWWAFATEGTRTGMLGLVRANGAPIVTPVWFLLHEGTGGDELIFTTGTETLKGKAIRRDPRISLAVDDQRPPYSYVQFTAEARLTSDLDEMREWATRIGGRYMGAELAEDFGRRNAVPEESLVRATITKVVARAGIAD